MTCTSTIVGWQSITNKIGIHREGVQRWIKLYGFPKPELVKKSRKYGVYWRESEVSSWLESNHELVTSHFRRCERISGG